jgi:hypothetical protein
LQTEVIICLCILVPGSAPLYRVESYGGQRRKRAKGFGRAPRLMVRKPSSADVLRPALEGKIKSRDIALPEASA